MHRGLVPCAEGGRGLQVVLHLLVGVPGCSGICEVRLLQDGVAAVQASDCIWKAEMVVTKRCQPRVK